MIPRLERIQSKARLIHICNSNISSRPGILSSWTVLLLKLTEVASPRILSRDSKRAKYLRNYVHFHQIMPIRFRIKWYIFSMFITACFHYNTNSWVDLDSVEFNSKKYSKITFFANKIYYNFIREYSNIINILNATLHYKRGTSVSRELSDENQNGRHFVTSLQFESACLNIAITN